MFKERKNIYVDPGKRSIFYMIDDNGNKLDYTNRRRIKETKRLKYNDLIFNYKNKLGIQEIEHELSNYNSKTCNIEKFKKYMEVKNRVNERLFEKYADSKFRQYKWYAYINRKRSEDNMLNLIEKKYGRNINIIMGDASLGKNMRGLLSVPNIKLKRKLKERFNVYHIDEFRSSCLHHKTEEKCGNLYYKDKKKRQVLKKQYESINEEMDKRTDKIMDKKTMDKIIYILKYLYKRGKGYKKKREVLLRQLDESINEEKNKKTIDKIMNILKNLRSKWEQSRKLHSVLTYKMENNRLGCINRDLNACLNIRKLLNHYLKNGDRPLRFQRSYKLEKSTNQHSNDGNQLNGCQIVGSSLSAITVSENQKRVSE